MIMNYKRITNCRVCKEKNLYRFLSLGKMPLANSFLTKKELKKREKKYPLDIYFCKTCGLVQLGVVVSPEIMFKNYVYVSSTSETMRLHFMGLAKDVTSKIPKGKLIVDIGSNDGTLLKRFKKLKNFRLLGIEPAKNIARIANSDGIETINAFFSRDLAKRISNEKGKADAITATNVFAHVDNLDEFLIGINTLLSEEGVFVIEVPYLINLLENKEFDTIYHEHLSYFSITPLVTLFRRHGMEVEDVKEVGIHGGSIRVFIRKSGKQSNNVKNILALEKRKHLYSVSTYNNFSKDVEMVKKRLVSLLKNMKGKKKSIVGYGAPAKGNTLLNYCGIDTKFLEYIVDKSKHKQGLYTPGTHIPVFPPEKILDGKPDYVFILAWNFKDEIIKQQNKYKDKGGKFIIPIPKPTIVE